MIEFIVVVLIAHTLDTLKGPALDNDRHDIVLPECTLHKNTTHKWQAKEYAVSLLSPSPGRQL
jgi:hypothetical protein